MNKFEAHGNATVELDGRTIVITPDGPGNEEEIVRVLELIRVLLPLIPPGPWGVLLIAKADMLVIPDAEAIITSAIPVLRAQGHLATALAILNDNVRMVLNAQFSRIYASAGAQLAVFDSIDAAKNWLEGRLLSA